MFSGYITGLAFGIAMLAGIAVFAPEAVATYSAEPVVTASGSNA